MSSRNDRENDVNFRTNEEFIIVEHTKYTTNIWSFLEHKEQII